MSHVKHETTPTETEKAITTVEKENSELKGRIENLEAIIQKIYHKVFREKLF